MAFSRLQNARSGPVARIGQALENWLESERDQLALWIPVALGAGIVGWFALPTPALWCAFILVAAAVALAGAALGPAKRAGRARPVVVSFDARIIDAGRAPSGDAERLLVEPHAAPNLPPRLRVNVPLDHAGEGLRAGAMVRIRARLMPPPEAAVPGAYDFLRLAWFQQIGATGRALGPVTLVSAGDTPVLAGAREGLARHIQARLSGSEVGSSRVDLQACKLEYSIVSPK